MAASEDDPSAMDYGLPPATDLVAWQDMLRPCTGCVEMIRSHKHRPYGKNFLDIQPL